MIVYIISSSFLGLISYQEVSHAAEVTAEEETSTTTFVVGPDRELRRVSCPLANNYPVTPGYRLAGISPSCLAVQIPVREITSGLVDRNTESQYYQFTYGQARIPFGPTVYVPPTGF